MLLVVDGPVHLFWVSWACASITIPCTPTSVGWPNVSAHSRGPLYNLQVLLLVGAKAGETALPVWSQPGS